jgi:uncharacterized protein YgbK (DUF1537 family)
MIGVIADDLTGAAELGGIGWRFGLTAEVLIEGTASGETDLGSLDTDSRSCSPDEAACRAAGAASLLGAAGAGWLYKKVDSVLRGPITAELGAVMERLDVPRTLLVPANPGLGRTIQGGRYFIRGKPIDETDFRHDPEFPRLTSLVRDLLDGSGSLPIHICTVNDTFPATGIIVGEVQSTDDLSAWAGRWNNSMLAAGGAEFFGALLRAAGEKTNGFASAGNAVDASERQMFVCGSASEACGRFVEEASRAGAVVFSLAKEFPEDTVASDSSRKGFTERVSVALRSNARVVLQLGLPPGSARTSAQRLTEELTALAAQVVRRDATRHVYAEGGATAASLIRRLGWKVLKVVRELAPGVVTLSGAGGQGCLLTIKPGSYSWPEAVRQPTLYGT